MCKLPPVCADLRFAKPRKFPKGNGFTFFLLLQKESKSSRRAATLSTPGERFKTLQNSFFVTFPTFVPKPVYGAARFFGCFEPVRKGYCSADARPIFFENGKPHYKLTGASHIRKGWLLVIFVAVEICVYSMLIESHELNRKFCHELQGSPFVQPHSFPFDVRHNLLSSKESVSSSYKAAYPFVQGLELAAVQIIAVDTVQKSGSHIAGYLSEAGKPIQNTVSTGDLNRGRRTKSRLLFGSFCRSKKNKLVPFRELPDKQEVCLCRAARCARYGVPRFCKPRIRSHRWQFLTSRFAAFPGGQATV